MQHLKGFMLFKHVCLYIIAIVLETCLHFVLFALCIVKNTNGFKLLCNDITGKMLKSPEKAFN